MNRLLEVALGAVAVALLVTIFRSKPPHPDDLFDASLIVAENDIDFVKWEGQFPKRPQAPPAGRRWA